MRGQTILAAVAALSNLHLAQAHTFIWVCLLRDSREELLIIPQGVFVNGVDQGTFRGIRQPAYNGPPPRGYANSPVKDLNSIDMRCNVLGDNQNPYTIKVKPGDNLTFDWVRANNHRIGSPLTRLPAEAQQQDEAR